MEIEGRKKITATEKYVLQLIHLYNHICLIKNIHLLCWVCEWTLYGDLIAIALCNHSFEGVD